MKYLVLLLFLGSCAAINKTSENLETTTKHLETTTEKFPEMVDQTKATLAELKEVAATIREEIPKLGANVTTLREEVVESLDNLDTNITEAVSHVEEFKVAIVGDPETKNKGLAATQNKLAKLGSTLTWIAVALAIPLFFLFAVVIYHKITTKKRHEKLSSKHA